MQSQREVKIRLILFCGLTIVFLIPISILYAQGKNNMLLLLCMMTPTLSVILTRMITREGTKELYIRPQLKKHKGLYLAAWLATPIIAWAGALLYFLIFPDSFDPLHSALATENQFTSYAEYWQFCLIMIPLAILINPIMGLVQCFGEEFAWRGYLLPKLLTFLTPIKAIIVTG